MKIYFNIIFLLVTNALSAQTTEPEGTIETLTGETLTGKIRYSNWTTNPSFIEFIQADKVKRYYPSDIKGFKVNDEQYFTFPVTYYNGSLDMNLVPEEYVNEKTSAVVFLKLLVNGPIHLFSYRNENRVYFFVQKPGENPEELVFRIKMKDRMLGEDKSFQAKLAGIAENAGASAATVQNAYSLNYDVKELSQYVNKLNGSNSEVRKETSDKLYLNFEGGAGALIPLFSSSGDAITAPINTINTQSTIGPALHAGLILSRNPQYSFTRWLLQFRYSQFNINGRSAQVTQGPDAYVEQYDFNASHLNVGLGMMQLLKGGSAKVKLYASATANVGVLLSKPGTTQLLRVANGSLLAEYKEYPPMQKTSISAIVSAGVLVNRVRAELFYQSPFRLVSQNNSNFSASTVGLAVRVGLKTY